MLTRVAMPSLSATMEEGMIVSWRVKEGDRIRTGGILAEIESDKSVFEYECPCEGVVRKLLVPEGQTCPVQATIAIIGEENEEIPAEWLARPGGPKRRPSLPPRPRPAAPERREAGPRAASASRPAPQAGEGIGRGYRKGVRNGSGREDRIGRYRKGRQGPRSRIGERRAVRSGPRRSIAR